MTSSPSGFACGITNLLGRLRIKSQLSEFGQFFKPYFSSSIKHD
jgi:hypothetical protein